MKFRYFQAILVLPAFLLGACTGLTELPMYWGNNAASPDIRPTGYHEDSKTGWMSYNDSSHLYFAFTFFDPRIQSQILKTGMTVFIDTTGRMKEGWFVRFPMIRREIMAGVQEGQKLQPRQGRGRGQRTSTEMLLDQAQSFELQYRKGKDTLHINPSTDRTGFKTSIGLDSSNALNMVIGIPINEIKPDGYRLLDKFVVGLRFGQNIEPPQQSGGRPQQGISQQAVLGGASAGVGGGGSSRGGRSRGGGRSSTAASASAGQIPSVGAQRAQMNAEMSGMDGGTMEFWYKTRVVKR